MKIDNVDLERVFENTFLGVILDHKFSWKPHVNHVRAKVSRGIGILYKVKHFLNIKSMNTLYSSLILPHLSYCVEVWGNTNMTTLQTLCTVRKRAIRIVNKAGYLDHTTPLFLKSKTLKFMDLVNMKTAVVFKARNNLLPDNIQHFFRDRDGPYLLRGTLNLKQINARTTLKTQCISVCSVKLWNGLPDNLKLSRMCINLKTILRKW